MFNAELLEKYHKGELQPEEMQQLEKAMLQNPFLAETVEGIAFSKNSFSNDVEALKQNMPYHKNKSQKDTKTVFFNSNQKIYSIAATILLLLVAGVTLWFFSQNIQGKSSEMAYKEAPSAELMTEQSMPTATFSDSATPANTSLTDNKTQEKTENRSEKKAKPLPLELKREVLAEKISSKDESPKQDIVTPSKVIDVQEGEQSDDAMTKPIVSAPVNTEISESAKSRSATIKEKTLSMDLQDKTVFEGQKDAKGKIASETKKNVAKKESKKIADTLKKYDTLKKDTILRKTKN
jgi:hypothetical protein